MGGHPFLPEKASIYPIRMSGYDSEMDKYDSNIREEHEDQPLLSSDAPIQGGSRWDRFRAWLRSVLPNKGGDEAEDTPMTEEELIEYQSNVQKLSEWIKIACLLSVAILAIGIGLVYLQFVLVPLVLARFFVYIFQPFINYMVGKKQLLPGLPWCRVHFPRPVAVFVCFLASLVLVALLGLTLWLSLREVVENYDVYIDRFEELLDNMTDYLVEQGFSEDQIQSIFPELSASQFVPTILGTVSGLLPQAILFFMFLIYMLLEYDETQEKDDLRRTIDKKIRTYVLLKILISGITGILVALVLLSLRVDMWMLFGLLSFLLNFIPSVGSMIAVLLPLPIVLLDPDQTWWSILLALLIPGLIQFSIGNFVEPNVMGKSMKMSAVSVLAALAFWGGVWGIVGAFISVPLTVILHVWLISIPHPMCQFIGYSIAGDFRSVPQPKYNKQQ